MSAASLRVVVTDSAQADLAEMQAYWERRGEPWRGDKYFRDLTNHARVELGNPAGARRGRLANSHGHPAVREILAFGVYRIIYILDETTAAVRVLRFWHAHRDEPGTDA